jgi:WhiB family transcriptional regulator, redox-sensing transcriptional regulator
MSVSWMAKGSCGNLPADTFFPTDSIGVASAQRICKVCNVRELCLEYALTNHLVHGVWGGTSERQRLRMQRERTTWAGPPRGLSRPDSKTSGHQGQPGGATL